MAIVGMLAPWMVYYHELQAFFNKDPEVRVMLKPDKFAIDIYVDDPQKAEALTQLLPMEKEFGNVKIAITVIPSNKAVKNSGVANIYRSAFARNEAVVDIVTIKEAFTNSITYIIFEPTVVQYYNDSLADAYGLCSTLYQDLAKNLFTVDEGIFFCTDKLPVSLALGK